MMRLLRVEVRRLRLRRAVVLLAVAAVLVPAVILVALLWSTRPFSADDVRAAEQQAAEQAGQPQVQRELARCEARPRRYGVSAAGVSADDVRAACEDSVVPRADWYLYRPILDVTEQRERGAGVAVAAVLTALALLVGATFAGHDWNSGSMSNQLLFESRRRRVWLAKGTAVAAVAGAVSLVVLATWWTGVVGTAHARDVDIADHAVVAAYKQAVLAAVFAALAALGGYALTMLFRSTVATLGLLFAVAVAGGLLLAALGLGGAQQLQPPANFSAYLVGSYTWTDYTSARCMTGNGPSCQHTIDRSQGVLYFLVALGVVAVPSLLLFGRRDVP